MRKQYVEEFYLRVQTNLFERALKESGIGFTREDDVISEDIDVICSESAMPRKSFSPEAVKLLQDRSWKGNIRELRNVVERLLILGDDTISAANVKDYVL